MVGSNETYRAALDEGFTQFAESWICTQMDAPTGCRGNLPMLMCAAIYKPDLLVMQEVYFGYLMNNLMGIG